ncbi:hypothetical protein SVAN01_07793 [Stagonosporopsis vannaccii]|nr:hypothetical protein SVAN01_07793 [Stagonosporopsis vannaccii]
MSSPTETQVSYQTYKHIDTHLTFLPRNLFHTIAVLTLLYPVAPSPGNPAMYDLSAMVRELESHGIHGYERTKSWVGWYRETALMVLEAFPTVKVRDAREGWNWMVRPGAEGRDVAGAVF